MFVAPGQSVNAVKFYRNHIPCVVIGHLNNECLTQSAHPKYIYRCLSDYVYTLTIPAENMTVYEQGSTWRCENVFNSSFRSTDVVLKIASKIPLYTFTKLQKTTTFVIYFNIFEYQF